MERIANHAEFVPPLALRERAPQLLNLFIDFRLVEGLLDTPSDSFFCFLVLEVYSPRQAFKQWVTVVEL